MKDNQENFKKRVIKNMIGAFVLFFFCNRNSVDNDKEWLNKQMKFSFDI